MFLRGSWEVFHAGSTKPKHATPVNLLERRAFSASGGGGASQRPAEALAFPLPGFFLNVIWDKQTSYKLALFLICKRADVTAPRKGLMWSVAARAGQGGSKRDRVSSPSYCLTVHDQSVKQQRSQHAVRNVIKKKTIVHCAAGSDKKQKQTKQNKKKNPNRKNKTKTKYIYPFGSMFSVTEMKFKLQQ